jgi:hypothetical protein
MDDDDKQFQNHLSSTANYHAAVVARGGTLWWLDPEKLTKLERHIPGISQMPPEDRRRALWERRHVRGGAA